MGSNARAGIALTELALLLAARRRAAPAVPLATGSRLHPDCLFTEVASEPYAAYLWGHPGHARGRFSIVTHSPFAVVQEAPGGATVRVGHHALQIPGDGAALALRLAGEMALPSSDLPFCGGAIGYVSYEHSQRYVGLASRHAPGPLPAFHFAFYDHAYVFDHEAQRGTWVGAAPLHGAKNADRNGGPSKSPIAPYIRSWSTSVSEREYQRDIATILKAIEAGDIYQANYTARMTAEGQADPAHLALRLRARNPAPMGACLCYPFGTIWSSSPERLLSGCLRGTVSSVPIKGTRRRETEPEMDRLQIERLTHDSKERAELLMIVDLVRNDLGKVARIGSVRVDELYRIQSYANVHHLEATISAEPAPDADWENVLAAVLPGGSITGAPKRSAVDLLNRLERVPRSVYTGALGYISFSGHADFSIPIRTLYHDGTNFHLHSGGGIVADSDANSEYEEFRLKVDNIRTILEEVCCST